METPRTHDQDPARFHYQGTEPLLPMKCPPTFFTSEATPFVTMLKNGKMTLQQIEAAILMTEAQRQWLFQTKCCDEYTATKLFELRQKVWKAFLRKVARLRKEEKEHNARQHPSETLPNQQVVAA